MLLLVVPLVGLIAVTGYAMTTAMRQSRDAARLSGNAQVSLAAFALVDALQAERHVLAAGQPTTDELRAAVESATEELRRLADEQGGALATATDRALPRVQAAGSLAITNTGGLVAVDGYSPAIAGVLRVSRLGLDPQGAIDDAQASATNLLATAQEAGAKERDLVQALAVRGSLLPGVYSQVSELAAAQDIQSSQAAAVSDADLAVRIDRVGDALAAASFGRDDLFFASLAGATVEGAAVDTWLQSADVRVAELLELRDVAAGRAVAAVEGLASSSREVLLLAAGALVAVLLISALLVRSAIRSIARPLTELATQADEVAMVRLPEAVKGQQSGGSAAHLPAIRATGASEVQEVAGAFNNVQETALRLAGEQAVMRRNLADALTNLGRRNQALLGRQLDFISSLEQRETDPAFLEHLFKLDHLASRMRRNAESLLILTGSETPRRRRKPAPLTEVVRAAMSEVEDFERVRLGHLGDATLTGPVVIDLVHMLAELIENALRFSPPDTTVEIDGRRLGQGGYQLAVIDHGVGMADVEIVAANQRLAGLDEVDGMPTRYLGQYVVARLATKTGSLVRLQPTSGGRGVTAVVTVPATGTVGGADRSSIARPLPGSKAAREAGPDLYAPGAGLTRQVLQPDAVIDPTADPYAEPVPTRDDLVVDDAAAGTEDWSWTPDVVAVEEQHHSAAPHGAVESSGSDVAEAGSWTVDGDWVAAPDHAGSSEHAGSLDAGSFEDAADQEPVDADGWLSEGAQPTISHDPPPATPIVHPSMQSSDEPTEFSAADFAAGMFAAEEFGAVPSSTDAPPPPPAAVPDQIWGTPPEPAAAEEVPLAAPTGAASSGSDIPSGLGGGLARRVPGQSLNDSPLGQTQDVAVEDHDRSADGVRSMLSAFQGGRSRGRVDTEVAEPAAPDTAMGGLVPTGLTAVASDPDHTSAPVAPELEDPRDH